MIKNNYFINEKYNYYDIIYHRNKITRSIFSLTIIFNNRLILEVNMKALRKAHFCGKALYNMLESGFSALFFKSMAINYTILLKPCSDVKTIFQF